MTPFLMEGEDGTYAIAVLCMTELKYEKAQELMERFAEKLEEVTISIRKPELH